MAQEVTFSGIVRNNLDEPLDGANLIAIPLIDTLDLKFSIADARGRFSFRLSEENVYKLEISYLGYMTLRDTITPTKDTSRNYKMQPSNESLDEIVLKTQIPVIVKEDTIIYRAKSFTNGSERKLKDILKKLPGVEVERNGVVKVRGKKVNKLMVDGKTFFTGSTKLAIENIPSDAVKEVEVLDNYNEVPFLKNLADSDEMAMNIKLAEDKKKFVFGDIESGGGVSERYIFHPTVFYYSPKTSLNLIGDVNNIGKKSFSLEDYVNFEGGILSLINDRRGFKIYNDDFARYLNDDDYIFSKIDFGALNIVQQINSKLRFNSYCIVAKNKQQFRQKSQLIYLTNTKNFQEFRRSNTETGMIFSITKWQLHYVPNDDEDLSYEGFVKTSNVNSGKNQISITTQDSSFIYSEERPWSFRVNQNITYSRHFSYRNTSTIIFDYNFRKGKNNEMWNSSSPWLNNIIPYKEDETYKIQQNTSSQLHDIHFGLKHYWVINNTNHIYPEMGENFTDQRIFTQDWQVFDSEKINDFSKAGFHNRTHFRLSDSYAGVQYKSRLGDLTLKPGVFYHLYAWDLYQFKDHQINNSKAVILPEFEGEFEVSSVEKFKLEYALKSVFTDGASFANRYKLIDFNRIYVGNKDLQNQLYHSLLLSYYKFSLFTGLFLNGSMSYVSREKNVSTTTISRGTSQISKVFYNTLPDERIRLSASVSKKIENFKFSLETHITNYHYTRMINSEKVNFKTINYSYTLNAKTSFKDLPNLEIGLQQNLEAFEANDFLNHLEQLNPFLNFEYRFMSDFLLNGNYLFTSFRNKDTKEHELFQIGDISLFYQRENSPWGFEIDADNIFSASYKNINSLDQSILTNRKIYVQPRTILFKISYKL